MVTDLAHFDPMGDMPIAARRLGRYLHDIVRAATAGDVGVEWTSVLACRRKPGRKPCPGRLVVGRAEPLAEIRWRCDTCHDEGVISNWQNSLADLRRSRPAPTDQQLREVVFPAQFAAVLRDLLILDIDAERAVYRMRIHPRSPDFFVLSAGTTELQELSDCLAAEANHESRQQRCDLLDAAFDVLVSQL